MIKSRLWRFLIIFIVLYLLCLLFFLRSVDSNSNESSGTSPLPNARVIVDDDHEPNIKQHHIGARDAEKNPSDLEPVMTNGELGNYEPKDVIKSSGPGEDGEGVQLYGDDIKKGQESVSDYGFNEVASEKISLDRRARDTRYQTEENQFNLSKENFVFI
jgi:hypothetical protein